MLVLQTLSLHRTERKRHEHGRLGIMGAGSPISTVRLMVVSIDWYTGIKSHRSDLFKADVLFSLVPKRK